MRVPATASVVLERSGRMTFSVLIVDDDPLFRAIASELLSPWFNCIEADGGSAALDLVCAL